MARKITAPKIDRFLWRNGLYIYFYDGNCEGLNSTIVNNMNQMAKKYEMMNVFSVDWQSKIIRSPFTPIQEMNTICLYFDGIEKERIYMPDKTAICEFFKRGVGYFNYHMQRRAESLGKRLRWDDSKKEYVPPLHHEPNPKRYKISLEYKKKLILNKKINGVSNFHNINASNNPERVDTSKKEDTETKKWFYDVQTTDLPNTILMNEPY